MLTPQLLSKAEYRYPVSDLGDDAPEFDAKGQAQTESLTIVLDWGNKNLVYFNAFVDCLIQFISIVLGVWISYFLSQKSDTNIRKLLIEITL